MGLTAVLGPVTQIGLQSIMPLWVCSSLSWPDSSVIHFIIYNKVLSFNGDMQMWGAGGAASSDAQADLRALNAAVTGAHLEGTLERGCLAVARAEAALDRGLQAGPSFDAQEEVTSLPGACIWTSAQGS